MVDVFYSAELVWLVWSVLEEIDVMEGWYLEDLGRVEEEVVFACLGCNCICELGKWIVSDMGMRRKMVVWKWDQCM